CETLPGRCAISSGRCESRSGRCETCDPIFSIDIDTYIAQVFSIFFESIAPVAHCFGASVVASYSSNQRIQMPSTRRNVFVGKDMSGNCLTDAVLQPGDGGRRVIQRQIPFQQHHQSHAQPDAPQVALAASKWV